MPPRKGHRFGVLTERDELVFERLKTYIELLGYAPTMRELADLADLASPSQVQRSIDRIEQAGLITRSHDHGARTIVLTTKGTEKVVQQREDDHLLMLLIRLEACVATTASLLRKGIDDAEDYATIAALAERVTRTADNHFNTVYTPTGKARS